MSKRTVPGVGFLTKGQLQYENLVRGLATEGNVAELCQRLREGMEKELSVTPMVIGEVSDAAAACAAILSGVQANVELLQGTRPTRSQVFRIQAQVNHLVNRVRDILTVVKKPEEKVEVEKLYDKVLATQVEASMLTWQGEGAGNDIGSDNVQLPSQSGSMEAFCKLPNPFLSILQHTGELTIDDIPKMIDVLWLTVRLQDQAEVLHLPQPYILQILYPLSRGSFSRIIGDAIRNGDSMCAFRKRILDGCVPGRCRNELLNKFFYRVQRIGEPFRQYVEDIRTAMIALCIDITESEAVNNIIEGMAPEDRSRVIFCSKPKNFAELDQLMGNMQVVKYSDEARGRLDNTDNTSKAGGASVSRGTDFKPRQGQGCFRCGRSGHFARECSIPKKNRNS